MKIFVKVLSFATGKEFGKAIFYPDSCDAEFIKGLPEELQNKFIENKYVKDFGYHLMKLNNNEKVICEITLNE